MISTTLAKGQKQNRRRGVRLWAVAVWLIVWQLGAMALGQEILLVSPVSVLLRLLELIPHWDFWGAILFSFWRITLGFLLACLAGTALGVLSSRFGPVRDLAAPLMGVIKSIPVASFVILVLIWVPSRNLSVVISSTTMNTAALSLADSRLRTRSWKSLSTPRLTMTPVSAPMPAPRAAPMNGTKKSRPNRAPQNRPHTVEVPTFELGVMTSYLPSARFATTAIDCRLTMRFLSRSKIFW